MLSLERISPCQESEVEATTHVLWAGETLQDSGKQAQQLLVQTLKGERRDTVSLRQRKADPKKPDGNQDGRKRNGVEGSRSR